MKVSKSSILLFLSLTFSLISCKKDEVFEELKLQGSYYDPNDSLGFVSINSIQVKDWGINSSNDTITLNAIISLNAPDNFFNNSHIWEPVAPISTVFYLNGIAHPYKYTDGVYTFNNYFRLMRDKNNTIALYAKLINSSNEVRRISNIYTFRIN